MVEKAERQSVQTRELFTAAGGWAGLFDTHTHGTRSVMTRLVRSCGRHLPAGYSGLKSAMFAARECLGKCNGDWKYGDEAAEDD